MEHQKAVKRDTLTAAKRDLMVALRVAKTVVKRVFLKVETKAA